jgi:cytochrome c biogenesis protein CcmG/thiol:disulfide interchange protein DsbE
MPRSLRRWIFPAVMLLFTFPALFSIVGSFAASRQAARLVGQPLPPLTLTTLQGDTLNTNALHGKPFALNFWATWCPPCRAEMPLLQAAHTDGLLTVIGVNHRESVETVAAFKNTTGVTFPIVLDDGNLSRAFGVSAYPTTIFMDATGTITAVHMGGLSTQDIVDALRAIPSDS